MQTAFATNLLQDRASVIAPLNASLDEHVLKRGAEEHSHIHNTRARTLPTQAWSQRLLPLRWLCIPCCCAVYCCALQLLLHLGRCVAGGMVRVFEELDHTPRAQDVHRHGLEHVDLQSYTTHFGLGC